MIPCERCRCTHGVCVPSEGQAKPGHENGGGDLGEMRV